MLVVRQFAGDIWFESTLGKGTTFTFYFELEEEVQGQEPKQARLLNPRREQEEEKVCLAELSSKPRGA